MTRQEILELLMLLSAMESWMLASKSTMPDYLHDKLCNAIELLSKEIFK
jgi:hypothetical protein